MRTVGSAGHLCKVRLYHIDARTIANHPVIFWEDTDIIFEDAPNLVNDVTLQSDHAIETKEQL